ncbi:unnamed protein product [Bemisia tabaci]|uniref:Uncharacterized protein n=1 Tax=Bemisia tabaci TaxID=7038 RepID=A0A9P0A436_BEMTA|nr:unnamed protein product [Bemisia tabaci]
MIFAAIQSAASALASVATWAVPGESSSTAVTESLHRLLNELKLLEKDRQKELNKALGNQEFMRHKPMTEFLSILSFVDCLFMEYLCYYDAVNTLILSDEGSEASRKAIKTIDASTEQVVQFNNIVKSQGEKLSPPNLRMSGQTDHLQALFKSTIEKNEEIEAQLRPKLSDASFKERMKDLPHLPEGGGGKDSDVGKIIRAHFCAKK